MTRFHMDDTEGYTQADLDALNHAFKKIMRKYDNIEYKSWQDHVAEELLFQYDSGIRGDALVDG